MIKIIIIASVLFLFSSEIKSQSYPFDFKDLEIPTSPAFIILDETPSTIERPASSKAFILSVFSSAYENNGIPQNYAVDFTPFWYIKHRKMNFLKHAGIKVTPVGKMDKQMIFGNIQKASISFAFVTTLDTANQKSIKNISLGARTTLLSIRSKKNIKEIKDAHGALVNLMKERNEKLAKEVPLSLLRDSPTVYHIKLKEFYKREEENIKKETSESDINNLISTKPLFALDGALGYNNFYRENNFSDGHFGRMGAWLTLNYSYRFDNDFKTKQYLNIYAIGRFLSDGTTLLNDKYEKYNYYDCGGKVELEFKRISLSYEYIYRFNDNLNTFKSSGIIKYRISDKLLLTGAYGKNFGDSNNLISLFGLNWGFSTDSQELVETELL